MEHFAKERERERERERKRERSSKIEFTRGPDQTKSQVLISI